MAETAAIDTTPAADEIPSEVQIEEAGPARKRIRITIPAEAVDAKINESFATMAAQLVLPGFRKGRAPRSLIEKRIGASLRDEAKGQVISQAYMKAIKDHGLRPIGDPEPEEATRDAKLESGKPFTASFLVEVVPTFDLPSVEGMTIKRPVIEVTDRHVDDDLRALRMRLGSAESITGPLQPYDRAACRCIVHKEGHEGVFFETPSALVVVPGAEEEGRGQVLGLLIEDLQSRLEGKNVGDKVTIETVGPELHEREDVRGAKLSIELEITAAERITPATDEELLARLGLTDVEELRAQSKLALEQRRDVEQHEAMREQLHEQLLKAVDFPLPENLTTAQVMRLIERQRLELLYRGLEPDQVETQLARMRTRTEAQGRAMLKLFFILQSFADKLDVKVTEQEVNGYVSAIASRRGQRPERLLSELEREGRLAEVAQKVREYKVSDQLLESAKIVDVPAEEWNKEVLARHAASVGGKSEEADGGEQAASEGGKASSSKSRSRKGGKASEGA